MGVIEVPQGRLSSPFYARLRAVDSVHTWHNWKGYTAPDALFNAETEYFAIRNAAAVFDLSPMTKYRIAGADSLAYLNRLLTRDMTPVEQGQVAYAVWCNEQGQVLDDGTVFHLHPGEYRLCSQERHYDWLIDASTGFDVEIGEETHRYAALALQGPTSFSVLSAMGLSGIETLRPFRLGHYDFNGSELTVSRTGFTGDLGYELWIDASQALALWDALFEAGADFGIRPIGTEALELARTEAGLLQCGVDFLPANAVVRTGRTRSPFELGLAWLVDFSKPVFNGRRALAAELREGSPWRFVRLDIDGNKPAENAYIFAKRRGRRREIGFTTSAVWSPICKQNIALGTVRSAYGEPGERLEVEIYYRREMHWARKIAQARVVEGPFWAPPRRRATPPAAC